MKKKLEIKTKEVPRIVWYVVCPICEKEISGNYEDQARKNLERHIEKHKKEAKKKCTSK